MKRFLAIIMIIALCVTLLSLGAPTVKAEGSIRELTQSILDTWLENNTSATVIDLDSLFPGLADGDTIQLGGNVTLPYGTSPDYTAPYFRLNSNLAITFDLYGYTLTGCDRRQLIEVAAGTLTVTDNAESGDGTINNTENYHGGNATIKVMNGGTVTIDGGTLIGKYALNASENSTLNINGGVLEGKGADLRITSQNIDATVNIYANVVDSFNFYKDSFGVINVNANTTLTKNSGDWQRQYMSINVKSGNTLTFETGVTINNLNTTINVEAGGTFVNNGTFTNSGEINVAGTFTNNGSFTNKESVVSSGTWTGTLNIAEGSTVTNAGDFVNGTVIDNNGTFTNDGNIIEQTRDIGWLVGVTNNKFISIYGSEFQGTAYSANTYTVLGVDANSPTYIVTIPAEVKLNPTVSDYQNEAYSSEFPVTLTNAVLAYGAQVDISIEGTVHTVALEGNSETTIPFSVICGNYNLTNGDIHHFGATDPEVNSQTADFRVEFNLKNYLRIAGTYSGVITFTCSYVPGT